jgi:hypothetical protein
MKQWNNSISIVAQDIEDNGNISRHKALEILTE